MTAGTRNLLRLSEKYVDYRKLELQPSGVKDAEAKAMANMMSVVRSTL